MVKGTTLIKEKGMIFEKNLTLTTETMVGAYGNERSYSPDCELVS